MYQSYWGLSGKPFAAGCDPRQYSPNPWQNEALARLGYLVENQRGLGLMAGPVGCGKTLLLELFAVQQQAQGASVAKISLAGIEPAELLAALAQQWGARPLACDTLPAVELRRLWNTLSDRVIELRYEARPTVLLLDDADLANPAVLALLPRLVRLDPVAQTCQNTVLVTSDDTVGMLGPRLLDQVDLRIELPAWEAEDVGCFIEQQLEKAGRQQPIFTPPAIDQIQLLSGGLPRRICQLAHLALLAGAGQGLREIDAETITAVCEELRVVV
jgi:general secretion pathway protein A